MEGLENDVPISPEGSEESLDSPVEKWIAVRLVSHHLRLLGVMVFHEDQAHLVLVDYDDDKDV